MVAVQALLLVLSSIGATYAHLGQGCGGHHVNKRNTGGPLREYIPRQSAPTDEASAAQSTDPGVECTAYSYQKVLDIKANYPSIWQTAAIPSTDTEAQQIFSTINATINQKVPNIKPKGTSAGDFSSVGYNATDPDCWWTWRQCTTPSSDSGITADISTMPEPQTWGFGFDDGPNCSHNALYDLLAENNQKATMFYIGSNVMDWPLQAMRGVEDGHQICIHTWSHQYMTSFSNEVAFAELYYTRKAIKEILGVTPKCWRPPFGDVDNRIRVLASELNLTTILWNEDSEDWRAGTGNVTQADVDTNYQTFITKGTNGTYANYGPVVLNHELNNFTMSEMVKYYSQIKSAYKNLVPIAVGLNETNPYVETNYTFPTFEQYVSGQTNVTTGSSSASATTIVTTSNGVATTMTSSASGSGTSGSAAASQSSKGAAITKAEMSSGMLLLAGLFGVGAML